MWACLCDCGNTTTVSRNSLSTGNTKSCGCLHELKKGENLSHSREYRSLHSAIQRCHDVTSDDYYLYGGRGISVYPEWREKKGFVKFLAHMGPRPKGHTLDRIDNEGNYEPGNCQWSSDTDQANNKRSNRLLTHGGQTMTVAQWARELNIPDGTLRNRLRRGWSIEEMLLTPKLR